jgi:histidine ammonia-lyase
MVEPGEVTLGELRGLWEGAPVELAETGWEALRKSAAAVEAIVASGKVVYGINTGFGANESIPVDASRLKELQWKLIHSHCCGTGEKLSDSTVRLALILKVIGLARGHSGVRPELAERMLALIDRGALPVVPAQGSVGASGDLAPLAHLTAPLIGCGNLSLGGEILPARDALARLGLEPLELGPKEGLALINGTQISTAIALEALFLGERVVAAALLAGALSLEARNGTHASLDERIHAMRGQPGQIAVAAALRRIVGGSDLHARRSETYARRDLRAPVQDPYSLRCQPQVAGASLGLIRHLSETLRIDANAVTDNPVLDGVEALSGGNFHAQPVAFAADTLTMALCEIGSIAERRVAMLVDKNWNQGLPAFLVHDSGVNSGFMIAHVTAAALASENKSLAFPASVDSIPTSGNQEDHVSMATHAACKSRRVAENAAGIVGIELLAAAQGLDLRRQVNAEAWRGEEPPKSSPRLERVQSEIREHVAMLAEDRYFAPDIAWAKEAVLAGGLARDIQAELFEA